MIHFISLLFNRNYLFFDADSWSLLRCFFFFDECPRVFNKYRTGKITEGLYNWIVHLFIWFNFFWLGSFACVCYCVCLTYSYISVSTDSISLSFFLFCWHAHTHIIKYHTSNNKRTQKSFFFLKKKARETDWQQNRCAHCVCLHLVYRILFGVYN